MIFYNIILGLTCWANSHSSLKSVDNILNIRILSLITFSVILFIPLYFRYIYRARPVKCFTCFCSLLQCFMIRSHLFFKLLTHLASVYLANCSITDCICAHNSEWHQELDSQLPAPSLHRWFLCVSFFISTCKFWTAFLSNFEVFLLIS